MPLSPVGLITAMGCSQAFPKKNRILTKTKRTDHITPILKYLHWPPVSYRIDFKALLLVFKSLNGIGPQYLSDMFQQYVSLRSLRSQQKYLLVKPTFRTKQGEAALSHYAVHLWNQLPEDRSEERRV